MMQQVPATCVSAHGSGVDVRTQSVRSVRSAVRSTVAVRAARAGRAAPLACRSPPVREACRVQELACCGTRVLEIQRRPEARAALLRTARPSGSAAFMANAGDRRRARARASVGRRSRAALCPLPPAPCHRMLPAFSGVHWCPLPDAVITLPGPLAAGRAWLAPAPERRPRSASWRSLMRC